MTARTNGLVMGRHTLYTFYTLAVHGLGLDTHCVHPPEPGIEGEPVYFDPEPGGN
jgi:hypothetical protein